MPALLSGERTQAGARGPEQGVIEDARRHRRSRRARFAGSVALALVAIAAVAWGFSNRNARHLASGAPHAGAAGHTAATGFAVRLSPALDGGQYGWCVGVQETGTAGIAGGGCGAVPTRSQPLAMVLTSASASTREESIVVLTTPQVAAVRAGGRRVVTIAPAGLPYGLRAARILLPLAVKRSAHGRLTFRTPPQPALAALGLSGQAIASAQVRPRAQRPALSARGRCLLSAPALPGLSERWSHVAGAIAPYPGAIVGRAFFSCIDTEYYLHGWPLDAAILLDAAHPGAVPAAIPGLSAVSAEPGYFNGPGDFKGPLTATRRGDAWVLIAGGSGLAQRLELLRHLDATVRAG